MQKPFQVLPEATKRRFVDLKKNDLVPLLLKADTARPRLRGLLRRLARVAPGVLAGPGRSQTLSLRLRHGRRGTSKENIYID